MVILLESSLKVNSDIAKLVLVQNAHFFVPFVQFVPLDLTIA